MSQLDFLLYDSVTTGPRGTDWSLKRATGALEDQPEVRSTFERYCEALPNEFGQLKGFGEALGGFACRGGYVLCVVLEIKDSFRRPSWAACGLWCPTIESLQQATSGDPISAVQRALGTSQIGTQIEVPTRKAKASHDRVGINSHTTGPTEVHRFERSHTVTEILSTLRAYAGAGSTPPDILGITATHRLAAVVGSRFERVYFHVMDERGEALFSRALSLAVAARTAPTPEAVPATPSPSEPVPEAELQSVASTARRPAPAGPILPRPQPITPTRTVAVFGLVMLTAAAVLTQLPPRHQRNPPSPDELLIELQTQLAKWEQLDPAALTSSWAATVPETVPVAPTHYADQKRVRSAFRQLIDLHQRMTSTVIFHLRDRSAERSPEQRLQATLQELSESPIDPSVCRTLRQAFASEFDVPESVVASWCQAFDQLSGSVSAQVSPVGGSPAPPSPIPFAAPEAPTDPDPTAGPQPPETPCPNPPNFLGPSTSASSSASSSPEGSWLTTPTID